MLRLVTLLTATLLLAGCSGMRLVESQVRTSLPAQASAIESGARYRFERLPSQTDPVETDSIEAIAEAELSEVGLVRDDKAARYSVLITTRMEAYLVDNWGRPYYGGPYNGRFTGSIMIGSGGYYAGPMLGLGMRFPPPSQYRHEVTLLIRDLQSNQVVYETRATHEGPWNDRYNILRATLAAALKDFPTPPTGPRRIKVEIPR